MSIFLDTANRFALPTPTPGWLQPIADYDGELVLFASQEHPVYRLCRRAHRSGGVTAAIFKRLPCVKPDTLLMTEQHLVPVTTILKEAVGRPPSEIVAQLQRRDQWRAAGGSDEAAADRLADTLDAVDADQRAAVSAGVTAGTRERARAMRVGYLYRTGARVSLVRPTRLPAPGPTNPPVTGPSGVTAPARGEPHGPQPARPRPR